MSDNNFIYVIRSSQKENSTDNTNSCSIRLQGLPQQFRYFEATVSALHISTVGLTGISTSTFELRQDGMNIVNGMDTQNNVLRTVAFASNNATYPQGPYTFKFENCNGKSIQFKLYGDNNSLLTISGGNNYNAPWILVLNLIGYN